MISINRSIYYEKGAKDKLGNILRLSVYVDTWFTEYHRDGNDSPLKKYVKVKKDYFIKLFKKSISHKFLMVYPHNQANFQSKGGKSRSEWSAI